MDRPDFPTMDQVEKADREQLAKWYRFLPSGDTPEQRKQMREAWPYASTPKFLLFDRDSKFGNDVVSAVREFGSEPVRTSYRSPGRTASRSVGLEAAAETCWIT